MDAPVHPSSADAAPHDHGSSEVHNASVDEGASRQGGCAQVHLPTGSMCTLRRGHEQSCEFSAAEDAGAVLADHRAAEGW